MWFMEPQVAIDQSTVKRMLELARHASKMIGYVDIHTSTNMAAAAALRSVSDIEGMLAEALGEKASSPVEIVQKTSNFAAQDEIDDPTVVMKMTLHR